MVHETDTTWQNACREEEELAYVDIPPHFALAVLSRPDRSLMLYINIKAGRVALLYFKSRERLNIKSLK